MIEDLKKHRFSNASIDKCMLPPDDKEQLANWIKNPTGFLIFPGLTGCGKTYLCYAIFNALRKNKKINFTNENRFFSEIRSISRRKENYFNFITSCLYKDLIIFEDLFNTHKEATQEYGNWDDDVPHNFSELILFMIENLSKNKKPAVFTTYLKEKEIEKNFGEKIHRFLFSDENIILSFGVQDFRKYYDV